VTEDACYFEWSAPEDADPTDPRTWRAAMPALGHTIAERTVAADLAVMPLEEFCRSHLNMWVDAAARERCPVLPVWAPDVLMAAPRPRPQPGRFGVVSRPSPRVV
jgi:hypothetical protein